MNEKIRLVLLGILFPACVFAQTPSWNAAELAEGVKKLGEKGRVLYIAAHPDDENTRLLAYLAKERKFRTGYLSLTRGDGGQNLIGNEQAELLGLIRTQELLAARRVDGAEQFFTRANDFGFSKTATESFKIWNKEQILSDVVWVIRNFKPDVIVTRFPEDSRAGHGHHSGSAILAREAFVAAADPARFPEQLKYVSAWQAKRVVWNTFNFGATNTTSNDQLKLDVGLYNPRLGQGYGEIAAISRTNHKSQGFGSALQRGESIEYFTHIAGIAAQKDPFEDISRAPDASITGLPAWKKLNDENTSIYSPSGLLSNLLALRKEVSGKELNHTLLDQLIFASTGLWIEANTTHNSYAAGDSISLAIQAIQRINTGIPVRISVSGADPNGQLLSINKMRAIQLKIGTDPKHRSQPYWLQKDHGIGRFEVNDQMLIGQPENTDQPSVRLNVLVGDQTFELSCPVVFKSTDPIKGERYQPVVIAPRVTATLAEKAYIFNGDAPKKIVVQLKNFSGEGTGYLVPELPEGWKANPAKIDFRFATKGEEQTLSFLVSPGPKVTKGLLNLQVTFNGQVSTSGLKKISYDHIPDITLFPKATATVEKATINIVGKRIAYISGAGDLVADALKQVGYEITLLNTAQLATADLSGFDAVVTGVRLYNISEEMKTLQPKLLKYVENGGTLLIQYNVNNGLKIPQIGPYPFKLANKRVTEEDAEVTFVNAADPSLNHPNKITKADFNNWVQERGLYFATDIDPKYITPLSMKDTGEDASNGALLIADYGKGKFVYTSLVFFRELPAGVTGAYRLMANLLAPRLVKSK